MKRDMDIIRALLLKVEDNKLLDGQHWLFPCAKGKSDRVAVDLNDFPDSSIDEINYHVALLVNAGFLEGRKSGAGDTLLISGLTWDGHEFLGNIKNDNIWQKTKDRLGDLPNIALKVVAAIAEAEVMKMLHLHS